MAPLDRWRALVARKSKLFAGDQALRKRLLSIGHLLTGNLFSSLVGFVAFALTARTLGPVDYGILALVYSYARAVERLISFQSWQPLIKYGAGLFDGGDQNELRSLLKFGLILDVGAAALAWAIAVLIALGGASLMGWTERTVDALLIYSFSMLFQVTGMPTAVMRLAGRFRTIAYGQLGTAIVRMILCAVGAYMMWGLVYFAAVWAASHILGAMTSLAFALYTLRQRGVNRLLSAPLAGLTKHFPGIWNFAWTANLSLTIRSSAQEFDTLLVGALSDPASAGLYHIAKRVSRVAQQIAVQVQAVLYPDVARLWAQQATEKFKRAVYQVEVLLFGLGVCLTVFFYFAAAPLLKVSVGAAFLGAAPLLIVQAIAVTLNLTGSSVRSALLAMGQQRRVLNIVFAATLAFHLTALAAIPQIGAMGANVAHIAFGLVWLSGLSWAFRSALKQGSSPPAVQDRGSEKSLDEEAEP